MELENRAVKADKLIYERFSPRQFLNKDVNEEKVMMLFEAARWAASSYNEQPWFFIYAHNTRHSQTYKKLLSCLNDFNQDWAASAPLLMLTVVKTYFEKDGKTNRHAMHDLGLAMGNLTFQATKLNLKLHHMAGFDAHEARITFNIPEGFEPATMVAIGYSDENKTGRSRKSPEEFISTEKFEFDTAHAS